LLVTILNAKIPTLKDLFKFCGVCRKFMGKIVAVANQKGGVGKTTTTINLGACLAQSGSRILLVDMDPQSNTTSGLGKDSSGGGVYELFSGIKNLSDIIVGTAIENLFLVPASVNLTAAELELAPLEDREKVLKHFLLTVKDDYDYIIIDCPPSLGLLTVNSLTAAHSVLIPLQCEYYALEGLGHLTRTIALIREGLNRNLRLEGILLTMYAKGNNISKEVVRQINEYFPKEVFKTIIPRNVRLSEAPSYGMPIASYDKNSSGAVSYNLLAQEVLARNQGAA
jgi:chromosome partitioning protein